MAASATQTFTGISPARFQRLAEKAQSEGIAIDSDSGVAEQYGVRVRWDYNPATETLELQCLATPFFVADRLVNDKLRALVDEYA